MPRGDNTGPLGFGAKTGRGLGNCSNTNTNNFAGLGNGRGRGQAAGRGLNRGNIRTNNIYNTLSLEEERKQLKDRLDFINTKIEKE
jgi:hypothetical protein